MRSGSPQLYLADASEPMIAGLPEGRAIYFMNLVAGSGRPESR
jgi:hypothetical protein